MKTKIQIPILFSGPNDEVMYIMRSGHPEYYLLILENCEDNPLPTVEKLSLEQLEERLGWQWENIRKQAEELTEVFEIYHQQEEHDVSHSS